MAQQRPKADDTKPADNPPPTVDPEGVDQLQARIADLEAQLAARDAGQMNVEPPKPAPVQLPVPADMPAGFVFNTVTGQQWCGACAVRPPDSGATSWTCDHGSWQAETQTYTPDAA